MQQSTISKNPPVRIRNQTTPELTDDDHDAYADAGRNDDQIFWNDEWNQSPKTEDNDKEKI